MLRIRSNFELRTGTGVVMRPGLSVDFGANCLFVYLTYFLMLSSLCIYFLTRLLPDLSI